jgi:uncharacterized cysteine cluster protein YcgN (CxxCxxCC family)
MPAWTELEMREADVKALAEWVDELRSDKRTLHETLISLRDAIAASENGEYVDWSKWLVRITDVILSTNGKPS